MRLDVNRRRPSVEDLVRIRAWATSHLDLDDDESVVVSELACREPGCPPVETVIGVLGPRGRRFTTHLPASEVTEGDVVAALERLAGTGPARKED